MRLVAITWVFNNFYPTRKFHATEAFICPDNGISASLQQAFRGAAVICLPQAPDPPSLRFGGTRNAASKIPLKTGKWAPQTAPDLLGRS